jgi:hypothetical protein
MFLECCSRLIARHRRSIALSIVEQGESQYTPSPVRKQAGFQSLRDGKTLTGAIPNHAPPRWRRSQSVAAVHAVAQERDPPGQR